MIWHFMQIVFIGDNLHEMSNLVAWENKKIYYMLENLHEMSNPVSQE